MHWAIVLGIAVISDILDYTVAGLPIIGDVLDLLTVGVLFPFLGKRSAIGFIELVPGADVLPTYTLLTLWIIWQRYKQEGRQLEGLDIPRIQAR